MGRVGEGENCEGFKGREQEKRTRNVMEVGSENEGEEDGGKREHLVVERIEDRTEGEEYEKNNNKYNKVNNQM